MKTPKSISPVSAPIQIVLTTQENRALALIGDANDREAQLVIALVLEAQGMKSDMARSLAAPLAAAAIEARRKIAEATRYEIEVRD